MSLIGANLRELLSRENLSENELGKRIGISQQVINRIVSGINQNPTLATLLPIARYFNIPLQTLVSEANPIATYSQDIPYIDWEVLQKHGLDFALLHANKSTLLDIEISKDLCFALSMYDGSMEPKFSSGSILIFQKDKSLINGDYCLLYDQEKEYMFRQLMINRAGQRFMKALNAGHKHYNATPLPINMCIIAILIESRTHFNAS